ncbi:MAG: acetolactate decarboxylase [Pseudodesulfovibrio sp.]|uniref:Alpha-acetolactate decarboxylase n=1 Tax=Pseudodesulfovibrio aespoeensis (strain ATCC 700646 / DSM 10631 / Aspo-2) TaxID=643562 RepID=E6VZX0_PSEA9|nr:MULTISPECIES: acetolactate decarboxylase [Pseudodesulfovibrio]MBU4193083.1 acetolactate decarboxylase [Pseudomonadota bacterium]ADU64052.1 alpha-acetolactate decarboxylase [Pseudodesulfovibrio aespoeensis Aspo-2]MBU4244588.1 acetolactate decarboxylase [Pseudomonadota bacterium]MBU4378867.1 acetolactate decarboxylase [Pseudomonadota bacterium]MBU4475336.1 acetolactate decarboxylase [Pseudomonadota bacterium]
MRLASSCRTLSALCLCLWLALPAGVAAAGDTLFQYSTIDALLAGLYDGQMSIEDLKYQGDFGLGTLNGLDGELVVLDGQAYHVAAGGQAQVPADSARTPFATVSFFQEDTILTLGRVGSLEALNLAVEAGLPSRNAFCAIRIDGRFPFVKARAIPRQNTPYAPLAEAVKQQVVVQFSGEGTLVGYYSPPFVKGVNVPGFHWHFLTSDRTGGGHVLDCSIEPTTARLDTLREFTVRLPQSKEFDGLDLTGDKSGELDVVEKGATGSQ